MTFRRTLRRCFVWLLCISLCLGLMIHVLAETVSGTELRLLQTEGTVKVSSTSGKTYSTREDMRLYNGYVVSTEEASYAWITLDAEKAVKLDECSSLEVRRSGKNLELLLKNGELYCDVTAPLKEDEKLNIRTSTMVTGVRGTIVYIQKINDGETRMGILEGHAQGVAINPVTGATRALTVRQGQIGVFQVYDADEAGEGADAWLLGMNIDDIPPFVQVAIAQDPAARDRVPKDLQKSLEEALEDLLKKQAETKKKLAEVEERKEQEVISKDRLWEGEGSGDSVGYTITWNIMGQLETTVCAAGAVPQHAVPVLEGYQFNGWTPPLTAATENATYTANFTAVTGEDPVQPSEQYTITWRDDEGNLLGTTQVTAGAIPRYEAPARDGYEFVGWDPDPVEAAADAEYTAIYDPIQEEETYTITWRDDEGNLLETTQVNYGEIPEYEAPEKEGYEFIGWDPEPVEATADAEYTAIYDPVQEEETYTITWLDEEGNLLETTQVNYGEVPEYEAPEKEGYEFIGWDPEPVEAAADTEYTAVYEAILYTITWLNEDGTTELDSTDIPAGEPLADYAPEAPDKDGYEFIGWKNGNDDIYAPEELPTATGDDTYTAVYEEITYDITLNAYERSDNDTFLIEDREVLVAAERNPAAEGETVTITAPGYYIVEFTVTDADGNPVDFTIDDDETSYSFVMPESAVTVEAVVEGMYFDIHALDLPDQNVSIQAFDELGEETNGARTGDPVDLRISWPLDSGVLSSVTMSWDEGSETLTWDPDSMTWSGDTENLKYAGDSSTPNGNINNFTFTMPASEVTIEITMLYNITVNYDESNGGGDVNTGIVTPTVDGEPVSQASPGDKVVLDIQLYNGYTVDFITYFAGDDSFLIEPVDGEYFFEMPDMDVRVYVSLSGT